MSRRLLWITRSQPGAARLAEYLEAAGYPCLIAPVLEIKPVAMAGTLPEQFDVAVALSEHAVVHAPQQLWAQARRIVAVGAQTARCLAELGFPASHPALASSEGLLEGPLRNTGNAKESVVLVSGRGGRTVLAEGLAAAGARVFNAEVYARQPVTGPPTQLPAVAALVVSSGDGFRAAGQLWFDAAGPRDVPVFAPSDRVAALACEIGFAGARNCGGADPESVLAAVRTSPIAL